MHKFKPCATDRIVAEAVWVAQASNLCLRLASFRFSSKRGWQTDSHVSYGKVLRQVFTVWGEQLTNSFSVCRQALKESARDRVQVVQVNNRLQERDGYRGCGEVIPPVNLSSANLVTDRLGLQDSPFDEKVRSMNEGDQNLGCLRLRQVARLGQYDDAFLPPRRRGIQIRNPSRHLKPKNRTGVENIALGEGASGSGVPKITAGYSPSCASSGSGQRGWPL